MFFIAQIQVAQQYSTLTAQNNSVTGTRRHRPSVCGYENWIQCPTSKHSDYFEVLRTFLDCGKCCKEGEGNPCKDQVQCHKKSSTYWIAYNSLMQHFVISHETPRRNKRHRCDSTLAQVRLLISSSCNLSFSDDCWIHSFAVCSPDSH